MFTPGQMHLWETAVFYQFIHTLVLLFLSRAPDRLQSAFIATGIGIVLFSGSLYLLALTGLKWLGAITPFGGLSFVVGWWYLLRAGWEAPKP
jgi:uncharacterized membrane protein YgdD (TMEM256/DUF423 family)